MNAASHRRPPEPKKLSRRSPAHRFLRPACLPALLCLLTGLAPVPAWAEIAESGQTKIAPVVPIQAEPFALPRVRLLEGPFRHAMEMDQAYVLSLDPDRLLHSFRLNAGLPSTAKPYGGWMTPGCVSCAEFVGHYMSACALLYASTGDERIRERVNRVVTGLGECQEKLGTGYIHTKPDNFTTRAEAPLGLWYQIHKLMAGLMEVSVNCENRRALQIAGHFGDWAGVGMDQLTDDQVQKMLAIEHGGINEAFANLYSLTGDPKYLKLALRFNHQEVIRPASRREDNLTGKHANTQIPKFVGAAREYELNGDASLKTASAFFWDTVVRQRSYVIGGDSLAEFFSAKETLSQALGPNTCETCNTYNMLKLTRHLFSWDPRAEYADFYERALYNHILASQNPADGMVCYFLPLASGRKEYSTPEDSFWCCSGTGIENHAKYGDSIYFHHGKSALFVNLFVASELRWPEAGIVLRQETRFPDEGRARFVFTCDQPVPLRLNIRHPYWAVAGFEIKINGATQTGAGEPGSYAAVERIWHTGDIVEVTVPFSLRTEGFADNPRRVALMYGPLVLCAETPVRTDPPYPALITDQPGVLPSGLAPLPGRPCAFTASSRALRLAAEDHQDVVLQPIHKVGGDREYVVYWNAMSPAEWGPVEAQSLALKARTTDRVFPGQDQSERDHNLRGENHATDGKSWRHAEDGAWFSWDLKVLPNQAQELRVKYWGGDNGGREFDVIAGQVRLATVKLDNNKPGEYYEETYALPDAVTRGQTKIPVTFRAHPGKIAGGVFGCEVLASSDTR